MRLPSVREIHVRFGFHTFMPWVYYGRGTEDVKMRAEGETPKMFNVQPPVQVKVDAIKRYGDEIISKFNRLGEPDRSLPLPLYAVCHDVQRASEAARANLAIIPRFKTLYPRFITLHSLLNPLCDAGS
jgi:hypothetical protein